MLSHSTGTSHLACVLAALLSCLGPASLAAAQGRTDYFNVESPQVKPMTVANIGGHDWLLVCNTPDNSVEIWDTDESIPLSQRFKKRVRVGLEPVSVEYNPVTGRVYTADFLSDSVSVFSLLVEGGTIVARPSMTRYVGDEPMDIAFSSDGLSLFVTHHTSSTFGWRDATTLDPVGLVAPLTDMEHIDLTDKDEDPNANPPVSPTRALKEPRAVAVRGDRLFVLGFKGGDAAAAAAGFFDYDFDLYSRDLSSPGPQTLTQLGTLGTTNFNLALGGTDDLWVVGGEAMNLAPTAVSERGVAAQVTGFVKSMIYRVRGAGTASPTVTALDLNNGSGSSTAPVVPVTFGEALAQPTDVVVYEPDASTYKVYFTAFGSDRIGVLSPTSNPDPYTWPLARISVSPVSSSPNAVAGPRGLALKYANGDGPARLYVLNRLDNSVSIIDPTNDTPLTTFALNLDPTPSYIREGRKFLYSANLSGSGFVSCASCHMDGRTDALVWKLGTPLVANPPPYPPGMADGILVNPTFAADKGPMVTQSLQGLLNFEVEPAVQEYFTNAPYHWRGDQVDLLGFNGAFVKLLLGTNLGTQAEPKGLTDDEMEAFRTFINSVHYPPNPVEPVERVYSGDPITDPFLPDPTDLTDASGGSAAQRGLLLFHIKPLALCGGRSCIQCHSLTEGSNNRGTVPALDPIESAAMRGLFQKESRLDKDASLQPSSITTGNAGLTHLGVTPFARSINGFINRFQVDFQDNPNSPGPFDGLLEVKKFSREFDWGVAPLVGRPYTFKTTSDPFETDQLLDLFEGQAQIANVGVAVVARIGGQDRGYWLDLTQGTDAYQLEGNAAPALTRAQLLALVVGVRDRLVFFATPLGSERRIASVSGTSAVLSGSTPTDLELRPCPTNSASAPIPTFRNNWDISPTAFPGDPLPTPFVWNGAPAPEPPFLKTIRLMQRGLVTEGQKRYGLTQLRHEAPRRFAVAGNGILPGAVLHLFVPNSTTPLPSSTGPLNQIPTIEFRLPIHPTNEVLLDGRRVWQTAVEVEPLLIYALMLGGPQAQGVPNVLDAVTVAGIQELPYSPLFDPHAFNWHYVRVINPDGVSVGDAGWQRLTLK